MGYSFWLAARVLLYAPSHIQDNTLHQSWSTGWNEKFKEGRKCFIYAQLYGIRLMAKDHSDSKRVNPLSTLHRLLFLSKIRYFLYAPSRRQDSTYHSLCYTSCGALAGMRNSSRFDPTTHTALWVDTPLWRERNVLFNDALNTFYLRLYGVRHMVKDHSDSEKGNLLPPHRLLLSINSKGSFICPTPQTG